jgi:hypothetical protein
MRLPVVASQPVSSSTAHATHMDFCRTVSGLARLYPYFEGCAACGRRTTVLGLRGFRVMLGSRLVTSCRRGTCQHTRPVSRSLPALSCMACTADSQGLLKLTPPPKTCTCSKTRGPTDMLCWAEARTLFQGHAWETACSTVNLHAP